MNTVIIDGLSFALPLFIMAIGGIYSEKSGITNLAIEGLQGFGAFTGALVAVLVADKFAGNSAVPFYIAMLFAVIGGMLFSLIHALLCIRFKANMVISGVVINILGDGINLLFDKADQCHRIRGGLRQIRAGGVKQADGAGNLENTHTGSGIYQYISL